MENHPNRDSPYVLTHENCTYFQLVEQSGNNAIVAPAQQIQRNYRVRRKIGNRTSGTITVQPIQHSDNFHFIERRIRECLNILAGRIMPWQLRNGINFEFTSNLRTFISLVSSTEDDPAAIYRPSETLLDPLISPVNSRELFEASWSEKLRRGIKKERERERKGIFRTRKGERESKKKKKEKIMIIKEGGSKRALAYLRGCKMESVYGRN